MLLEQILDPRPVTSLADHLARGGGRGLEAARDADASAVIEEVAASGLRGRGGGGFPTGAKWRTVAANASAGSPTPVVVNAAEGEPGTFKDHTLLRTNPYRVIEGALIAAHAVGAVEVLFGMKASAEREISAVARAITELEAAGLPGDVRLRILPGPGEYLFGEETAMLEVAEGRQPFPRVVPPFRRGLDDPLSGSGHSSSISEMATTDAGGAAPTLVNNVETLANVPGILADGAAAYRATGTAESPGTIVCTISGRTVRHGVAEVEMGTSLLDVINAVGGGAIEGRTLVGALSGAANPIIPADLLDTPLTYEAMAGIGGGLGAAGFIVFDDSSDMVAVAHGVARFLAVESCGQCEPCKADGLAIASGLDALRRSDADGDEIDEIGSHLATITDGARCSLASQQERVVGSILSLFPEDVRAHLDGSIPAADLDLTAPILDIRNGQAVLDQRQRTKQPDWSHDDPPSGTWPAALLGDTPVSVPTPSLVPAGDADPSGDASLGSLRVLHARLTQALDDLPLHPCPQRTAALQRLAEVAARYHDVTERVLYPLARRKLPDAVSAPVAAEDATGETTMTLAELDRTVSEGLLERILAHPNDDHAADLESLVGVLRDQVALDEGSLVPQLEEQLSEQELRDLDSALEEARLTSLEGSGPTGA